MPTKEHLEKQRKLFNDEFKNIDTSQLEPWQASYMERIHNDITKNARKGKFVELGAGDGRISAELAKEGYDVVACDIADISIKLIEDTKKRLKLNNLSAKQCDVTKLPFKDQEFDGAIANSILEHLEDEETALSEWSRVLKPGGRILIVTPLRQRHVLPIWWILNWFHDRRLGHQRRYDTKRYKGFKKYGLQLKKIYFTGHFPKVVLTLLNVVLKNRSLAELAEKSDVAFSHIEYDGNNVIGIFEKVKAK